MNQKRSSPFTVLLTLWFSAVVMSFGLATLSWLIVTFSFGFFMKKNPKVLHLWHKRLAYVTIVVALCHATLVLLTHNL